MPGRKDEIKGRARKCYFCGAVTIRFAEHWLFCPQCAAIYTHCFVWETFCKHIKDDTPVVRSECWFKKDREKKAYIKETDEGQFCSKCGEPVEADGW